MEPDSALPVPYQAYKSKRHSRNGSSALFVPNVSPPPLSRPPSTTASQSTNLVPNGSSLFVPSSSPGPSSSSEPPLDSRSLPSDPPSPATSSQNNSISFQVVPPVSNTERTLNGTQHRNVDADTNPNSMSPPLAAGSSKALPAVRKSSKFRHVPLRGSKSPLPSSPLRPGSTPHSRSTSLSSTSHLLDQPYPRSDTESRSRVTSLSSIGFDEKTLPPIVVSDIGSSNPPFNAIQTSTDRPLPQPTEATHSRPSSLSLPKTLPRAPTPTSSTPSTTPSVSPTPPPTRPSAPYRPGFQPKGVYRPRTDEFTEFRKLTNDRDRTERTKLERRLEKLIDLHFPRDPAKAAPPPPTNRRASSFFDFDLSGFGGKDAGGIWKGMLQGAKVDIRAAEQRITPWQEDSEVSKCPLCSASFHPLSNRKHHCRLCGKIICSLPVKHPQRPVTCSLLFVVDNKTRQIEEVGEGVDYGVRKRRSSTPMQKGKEKEEVLSEDEKFLKGVRICRQCRPILLRQQHYYEVHHVPAIVRFYQAFIILEREIEDSLPQFQELILSLSHDGQPTKEASAARKRLLEAFSQYDVLAKRIRNLPTTGGPGNSHERVQMAILARSNLFLQKNMVPLQSLPRPTAKTGQDPRNTQQQQAEDSAVIDLDSELAHTLQPLLEQEALLETFVEEAKARRKFEDAKTLKANLSEIRAEIDRVFADADSQSGGKVPPAGKAKPVR